MTATAEAILAKVELVAIEAGRRSAEIETQRALPRDLVDALTDSGVLRLAVPTGLGGVGADLAGLLRAARVCAAHDGSLGWLVMTALMAAVDASRLPHHHATTVLGDPRSIVVGHRQPGGLGRLTEDGGLVVTGRWSWGSGAAMADWVGAGVEITGADGGEGQARSGRGEVVQCLFRRDQVVVLDTWHAVGLRGTGSTDFQVTEAFVPEGRWVTTGPGTPDHGRAGAEPLTGLAQDDLLAVGIAAVSLGLAARAVEEIVGDIPGPTPGPVADEATGAVPSGSATNPELARLETGATAAEALIERAVAEAGLGLGAGDSQPLGRRLGPAALHAVEQSVAVVEHCYRLGGQPAVLHASPLQRLLRDVNTAAQHPLVSPDRWAHVVRRPTGSER